MAQKGGDVIFVNIRRPESCGKGVPEAVEVEIADPGFLDRPLETDHQLAPFAPGPRGSSLGSERPL